MAPAPLHGGDAKLQTNQSTPALKPGKQKRMQTDKEVMDRIKNFKGDYDKLKAYNKELEREGLEREVQIEMLVKRVRDLDHKKNEFK